MRIVFVGAGNLATNFGKALHEAGNDILQVYSRTYESASALAMLLDCSPVTNIDKINNDADVYVISVSDNAMADVVPQLCNGREDKIFIHTAGSVPINVFEGMALHYGVIYPMQTFSKNKEVKFKEIPCFIEGNDNVALETALSLAGSVSDRVYRMNSEERKYLHLAAVFACNFVNHCYGISFEILRRHNISFDVMMPLIDETARKVHTCSPVEAQTGPAVRYDQNIIRLQSELLKDNPVFKKIYEYMSVSINQTAQKR